MATTTAPRASVLAPAPVLGVTVEQRSNGPDEVHLHVAGQAYWIARMVTELGVESTVVATVGGEPGVALRALLESERFHLRLLQVRSRTGVYVHDRRSGERREVADAPAEPLDRHAVDDLYGAMVSASLGADIAILAGSTSLGPVPHEIYERLSVELRGLGCRVLVDLSGPPLAAALRGGVDVLKVSDEELTRDGRLKGDDEAALRNALERLRPHVAQLAIITRSGGQPALAAIGDRVVRVSGPRLQTVDDRGVGDSLSGGVAAALAHGHGPEQALRVGAAAAALNATRRGAGSGAASDVEAFAGQIDVTDVGS